jgi:phosphoglycerate dehydrogenase-like enzyme
MVINAPNAATQSVVELALGYLLSSARDIGVADRALREGQWIKSQLTGSELFRKRIGFLGFGRIGQKLGEVCLALGMELHGYDPFLPDDVFARQKCQRHTTPESLFKTCTHISIHCNLTSTTRDMVDAGLIESMPQTASDGTKCGNFIVNCARGGIVNEKDALEALRSGKLSGLALDVFEFEPTNKADSIEKFFSTTGELLKEKNFIGTPHIGSSTKETQSRVGVEIVSAFVGAIFGSPPRGNVMNPEVVLKP